MRRAPLMPTLAAAIIGAVLAATALVVSACSSPPSRPDTQDLSNDKSYSLTQTIQNTSGIDMTVQSVTADNGGTVVPGYPSSLAKNSSATFKATNTGNGVQVRVTLTAATGQILVVDSDVPKVEGNWSTANLTGTRGGLSTGRIDIGGGDNPAALFVLEPCTELTTCTTSATTQYPPLADPSKSPTSG